MSNKLTEFLSQLTVDSQLSNAFKSDKSATMKAHGISEEHIQMVINKNYHDIQEVVGCDYSIATNSIIHAYKINITELKPAQSNCQLTNFLTRLACEKQLCEDFKADKSGVMKAHGISNEHIEMVVNGEYEKIQNVIGFNHSFTTNGVIKAFKIEKQSLKAS
jgi:hypothetical protein